MGVAVSVRRIESLSALHTAAVSQLMTNFLCPGLNKGEPSHLPINNSRWSPVHTVVKSALPSHKHIFSKILFPQCVSKVSMSCVKVMYCTIENNDQVKPHFAQMHVTKKFWSCCKVLMPKLFLICMPRCAKERFWRFLDFYTMKINL